MYVGYKIDPELNSDELAELGEAGTSSSSIGISDAGRFGVLAELADFESFTTNLSDTEQSAISM